MSTKRKRVTLHPLRDDGTMDLNVNLYPKTFLDGIVDREGNEVDVATREEIPTDVVTHEELDDAISDLSNTYATKEYVDTNKGTKLYRHRLVVKDENNDNGILVCFIATLSEALSSTSSFSFADNGISITFMDDEVEGTEIFGSSFSLSYSNNVQTFVYTGLDLDMFEIKSNNFTVHEITDTVTEL